MLLAANGALPITCPCCKPITSNKGVSLRFGPLFRIPGEQTCAVVEKPGTSMATPVVAGAALIARQYFREGYYPSGVPSDNSHVPSGPLLRAILIGGAVPMLGFTDWGLPLVPPPSARQGHGRVQLNRAVPLAGSLPAVDWRL